MQQLQPITEINECALRPDICGNGKCIDTKDGYECDCYNGFTKKGNRCEDIDECLLGYCQGGTCRNYEGSFSCQCPPGFVVSGEGRYCTGKCNFAREKRKIYKIEKLKIVKEERKLYKRNEKF